MSTINNEIMITEWLKNWISKETGLEVNKITIDEPFVNFGMNSRQAITLSSDMEEEFKCELDVSMVWEYPTIDKVSSYVAQQIVKK